MATAPDLVPSQSDNSKIDALQIGRHIESIERRPNDRRRMIHLTSRPDSWTDSRIGSALIHHVSGGWSPFGGECFALTKLGPLGFLVRIYAD